MKPDWKKPRLSMTSRKFWSCFATTFLMILSFGSGHPQLRCGCWSPPDPKVSGDSSPMLETMSVSPRGENVGQQGSEAPTTISPCHVHPAQCVSIPDPVAAKHVLWWIWDFYGTPQQQHLLLDLSAKAGAEFWNLGGGGAYWGQSHVFLCTNLGVCDTYPV